MGTTLDNGIYLPDEGERNCYEGLAGNWVALDNHLGSTNIHVTINDKQAWDGHVADSVKHVTAEDKNKWDAVTSKADDSDVVHKSGNETIGGKKTFTDDITASKNTTNAALNLQNSSYDPKTNGQSAIDSTKSFSINVLTSTSDLFSAVSFYGASDRTIIRFTARYYTDSQNFDFDSFEYILYRGGTRCLRPRSNNNTTLGESSRKWKDFYTNKINALEPSSLSLPSDRSARIDISSYFTNTGTGQSNSYTVPANGYIYLTLSELTNVHCFSRSSGNVTNYAQTFTKLSNSTGALYVLFPVRKNDVFVATWYTTTTVSVDGAFFIPCQGNI